MPFASLAQSRYLHSKASPLSDKQKREWENATDFSALPPRAGKNMSLAEFQRRAKKGTLRKASGL